MALAKRVRQAVVVVHGMGEQRPLDMLNRFIDAAIDTKSDSFNDPAFYSRPDEIADSYESRCYLAPESGEHAQTDFYEYHWAHLMQGNRLGDMWTTFRRMMWQFPWQAPPGLRVVWFVFWGLIIAVTLYLAKTGLSFSEFSLETFYRALFGGGLAGAVLTWLFSKVLPGKISSSFVDVVRYLDTSPRSYAARKDIRKGIIEMLENLHKDGRYQRIVVVAHSLGGYIAYDGICHLWSRMNQSHSAKQKGDLDGTARRELEAEADLLLQSKTENEVKFREQQRELWTALRKQGNPWLITDFITLGTPMCMADQLWTRDRAELQGKIDLRQFATCPPQPDLKGSRNKLGLYSYVYNGGTVLYHAAPFAVVRWTNMWFPARFWFFGDWFGGPLRSLFGTGISDIELKGNRPMRFIPALAHTLYFRFPKDLAEDSVTVKLRNAMDLKSTSWLNKLLE